MEEKGIMEIEKGKKYRIKSESPYFKKKYGSDPLIITIEGTDKEVFGGFWGYQKGNPTCMLYGMRAGFEGLPNKDVWYGKIGIMGELVHVSELEEIKREE